jgi:hypothetical protein
MRVAARRISSRGLVKVRLTNANDFAVSGKVSGRTTNGATGSNRRRLSLGGRTFVLGAGTRKGVTLKLPRTAKRLLVRERKLSVQLAVRVSDPAGNTRTVKRSVSLRPKAV